MNHFILFFFFRPICIFSLQLHTAHTEKRKPPQPGGGAVLKGTSRWASGSGLAINAVFTYECIGLKGAGCEGMSSKYIDETMSKPILPPIHIYIYIGLSPLPVTVTTRMIPYLVGNPYKPLFVTVTGQGDNPIYIYIISIYIYAVKMLYRLSLEQLFIAVQSRTTW